jgi:hypothetical protein
MIGKDSPPRGDRSWLDDSTLSTVGAALPGCAWTRYGHRVEPLQPVDPSAEQKPSVPQQPAIPQARRVEKSLTNDHAVPGASEVRDAEGETAEPNASEEAPAGEKLPGVWNVRSIMLIVLAFVLALCGVGAITAYNVYNKIAEPDRTTPSIAVRKYLQATFDERDQLSARRFTCSDPENIEAVTTFLEDVRDREQRFDLRITIAWEEVRETVDGDRATVTATLKVQVPEGGANISESLQKWTFSLEGDSGWRVCGAKRLE